jgi:hypothetical protein
MVKLLLGRVLNEYKILTNQSLKNKQFLTKRFEFTDRKSGLLATVAVWETFKMADDAGFRSCTGGEGGGGG